MAEELGISYLWNDMAFSHATKEDEKSIQSALDSEEAIAGNGDWAVKLGINLFYSASLSRSHLYSKQMHYNSVIYNAFGHSSPVTSPTRLDVYGRRPAKQKKVVAGKWCGKVWMSNQVHPFLIKRDPEEEEIVVVESEERSFRARAMPDEKLERKSLTTCKTQNTSVTKKYARKRKVTVETGTAKKAKYFEKEEAVSDYSVDDNSHRQQRRFPKSKQTEYMESGPSKNFKCVESDDAFSDDSMEDDSHQQNGRNLRSEQGKYIERNDVSDDSMGVESPQQHRRIPKSKQAKHMERDAVSDDSVEGSSRQPRKRVLRSKTAKSTARENLTLEDISNGVSSHQQRRSISKSKLARFMEREDAALDETPEDNFLQQYKRILRNKQTKPETLRKMKQEASRQVKQGTAPPVKQGSRTLKKQQTPQQKKQQTPRLRNNQSENNFDLYAEEEKEGGPSTRLRKRAPKPLKESGTKPKEQKQSGRKKAKTVSAVKAKAGRNDAKLKEEEGEFACDIEGCIMSFGSKHELSLHKRNICPFKGCGKKFFSHKYLVQHRRVHTDDRPLRCPWKGCKMTFKWAWARTEHIRVHTGVRPYVCAEPGCGQTFRFVSDFSRHKRKTGHSASTKKSKG